ncbi:DgyrCDS10013 [Dimorphilus gyrociliatus]|uniref:DgyrCDS10013 n=1 Tax=Dimorphilus gyrociliatus TaxID=2664684 RepID=A0A7I8VZ60_9ANNE|nr:DgyrCDS10013 [Dimorphilus gyrociliatus]
MSDWDDAINAAQRQGASIDTSKKFGAASNKQHSANKNTAKLDRETEELHHDKLDIDTAKMIQKARQNKELTQKELAARISERPQIVNEYESGKAIPNQQILTKLERALGVKLRGKDKGKPLVLTAKK